MFILAKILGGRMNVHEPHTIPVTALSAAIAAGTPVNIAAGVVTPLEDDTTVLATHIVEKAAASGATKITVSEILPGNVYEVPVSATPTSMGVGGEYKLAATGDKVSATAVSSSVRGALLYDLCGAAASGDKILVTFPLA